VATTLATSQRTSLALLRNSRSPHASRRQHVSAGRRNEVISVSSPIWPEAPASSSALQVRSNLDLVYDDEERSVVVFRDLLAQRQPWPELGTAESGSS
jgi:hypothetical protein